MPTPEELLREYSAQRQLEQQGSVMAQPSQRVNLTGHPVIDPLLGAIGTVLRGMGPNVLDTFTGSPEKLAGLASLVQGLMGGTQGSNEAGVYRDIGLQRTSGALNPAQYLMQLQSQPNYARYLELVQNMVRRGLGEQFPIGRGAALNDPLVQALQQGRVGSQLPVTAVSWGGAPPSGTSHIASGQDIPSSAIGTAERFAQTAAEKGRKTSYVAQGTATPADVAALVPRRNQFASEAELILKPTDAMQAQLAARYTPPSSQFPWVERKALEANPNSFTQEILNALAQAAQPPTAP